MQIIRTITRLPNCYDNSVLVWQRTFREFGKTGIKDRKKISKNIGLFFKGILHRLCLLLKLTIIPVDVLIEVSFTFILINIYFDIHRPLSQLVMSFVEMWKTRNSLVSWQINMELFNRKLILLYFFLIYSLK
jgi:hypothetical protein